MPDRLSVSFIVHPVRDWYVWSMKWFYIYVLYSLKDQMFYTGFTQDLEKRLQLHKKGKVYSTKHRTPLILVYHEACLNKYDALAREKYLKSGMGKRYIKNRLKRYLEDL
jgi:putative endonuclease